MIILCPDFKAIFQVNQDQIKNYNDYENYI